MKLVLQLPQAPIFIGAIFFGKGRTMMDDWRSQSSVFARSGTQWNDDATPNGWSNSPVHECLFLDRVVENSSRRRIFAKQKFVVFARSGAKRNDDAIQSPIFASLQKQVDGIASLNAREDGRGKGLDRFAPLLVKTEVGKNYKF